MALNSQGKSVDLREYTLAAYKEGTAWLRDYVTAIKNGQLHPYTKLERKAREATRNEPWGPTGTILNELAQACGKSSDCQIIFAVIQLRLGYPPAKWRNVYKALTLLEFLLKRGPENCVRLTRQDLTRRLQDLEGFQFVSPDGKDLGANVRLRAQAVHGLVRDERRLNEEREAIRSKHQQYAGYSRGDMLGMHSPAAFGSPSLRRSRSDGGDGSSYTNYGGSTAAAGEITPQSKLQPSSRGAGEMKGITMEDNKKQLAALKKLLEQPGNRNCADCAGGGAASRATWASINTGVFICMRCAGIHRGLGVHISKVRSCTLDTWLPEQVAFMARTGNAKANAHFEARLEPTQKPSYYSPELESFIRRKYNGEYAKQGEDWPPAEAFAEQPAEQPAAAAPPQQQSAASSGASSNRTTARTRHTQSAREDEGFGESAFAPPPPPQRTPSAPNLMDFGAETPTASGSIGSVGNQPLKTSAGCPSPVHGLGMDEFQELMAASAHPNLLDDNEMYGMPAEHVDDIAMTPEPVMHSRHLAALGVTPPRSLLSSFSAAARAGDAQTTASHSAAATDFGPPTHFGAPGAFGSHAAFPRPQEADSRPTARPDPFGASSDIPALASHLRQPQASLASQERSISTSEGPRAMRSSHASKDPFRSTSAQEASFKSEPAPRWEQPTKCAPPPAGAIYSAGFSAATQSVLQRHMQPLGAASSNALAHIPKAASRAPYRPPGMPGGPPAGAPEQAPALVPALAPLLADVRTQQQQDIAPVEEAWYAQSGALNGLGAQQASQNKRVLPQVPQGPRRGTSDPSGSVMEDLLAHAVDNMRIKNAGKTQLARRPEQPPPSLLEQKMGARIGAAKG